MFSKCEMSIPVCDIVGTSLDSCNNTSAFQPFIKALSIFVSTVFKKCTGVNFIKVLHL